MTNASNGIKDLRQSVEKWEEIRELEAELSSSPIRLVSEEELKDLRIARDKVRRGLAMCSEQMTEVVEKLNQMTASRETFQLRTSLGKEKVRLTEEIGKTTRRLAAAKTLLEVTRKAELTALARTLANLNLYARDHLDSLFTEPIVVSLSTSTILKTTGKKKAAMSTTIEYRGMTTDDFDALSGGEKQRCSLAYVLAANELTSSPVLLLDECLNNLDSDTNTSALGQLRAYAEDRLVLVISHEAVEGVFDGVIVV